MGGRGNQSGDAGHVQAGCETEESGEIHEWMVSDEVATPTRDAAFSTG